VLNPNLIKGSWTREEDEIIIDFVLRNGAKNWVRLAEALPGRIGKQCRERWTNHLSPSVARQSWNPAEDETLIGLHARFGNQWTVVASFLAGRTDNDVKNRWNSSLKRRIERRSNGEPEFKKRGREPKLPTRKTSECESPELDPPANLEDVSLYANPMAATLSGHSNGICSNNDSASESLQQQLSHAID
jgi:hypothetical protein